MRKTYQASLLIRALRAGVFTLTLTAVFSLSAFAFPKNKDLSRVIANEYYDSFANKLGIMVNVYELESLAAFDGSGYQRISKGAWYYYPPVNYLALEWLPGVDWVAGYRADWYFQMTEQDMKVSFLASNLWKNWTTRKVTYFSPLTLYKVQFPGIKVMVENSQYDITAIYSWIDSQEPQGDTPYGDVTGSRNYGVSLMGAAGGVRGVGIAPWMELDIGVNYVKVYEETPYLNDKSSATLEIMGPALSGEVLGASISAEYASNKLELTDGTTASYAMYFTGSRGFYDDNISLNFEYYHLEPNYNTVYETENGRFNLVEAGNLASC